MRIKRESASGPVRNQGIRLALNKRLVEGLEPSDERYYIHDAKTPSLTMSVFPSGTKSWVVLKNQNGRARRMTLGRFPVVSVEQARKRAAEVLGDIASGGDPFQAKADSRKGVTLGDAFTRFMENHVLPKRRPRTAEEYRGTFERHLKRWGNRKISDITRQDVESLHVRIGKESGHTTANRVVALIRSTVNHVRIAPNPAAGIEKFAETSRERFLDKVEIGRLVTALDNETNETFRDYVRLSLWTGARQWTVITMRWDDLDLDAGVWSAKETKGGRPQAIYLSPQAVSLLRTRKPADESEYVLPGRYGRGHMFRPYDAWRRLMKRAEIENFRPHDLRRTLASWQAASGISLHVVGKTLGHTDPQATKVYARLDLEPVKHAVDIALAAMSEATKGGVQ